MKTIVLDPGHGGAASGAVGTLAGAPQRLEKDDCLRLANLVKKDLETQGHSVRLTRQTTSENPTLENRIKLANDLNADLFLSLHRNSFTDSGVNGIEIWVRYQNHLMVAVDILEAVAAVTPQNNRGVKVGAYIVLYNAKMPAALLELGFISNELDNELFDKYLEKYAQAISRGICHALGVTYIEDPLVDGRPLYRVQVGAFLQRINAERFLQNVQKQGLAAFLVEGMDELFRVQVGAFSVKENAERFLREVREMKLEAFLIEPVNAC